MTTMDMLLLKGVVLEQEGFLVFKQVVDFQTYLRICLVSLEGAEGQMPQPIIEDQTLGII